MEMKGEHPMKKRIILLLLVLVATLCATAAMAQGSRNSQSGNSRKPGFTQQRQKAPSDRHPGMNGQPPSQQAPNRKNGNSTMPNTPDASQAPDADSSATVQGNAAKKKEVKPESTETDGTDSESQNSESESKKDTTESSGETTKGKKSKKNNDSLSTEKHSRKGAKQSSASSDASTPEITESTEGIEQPAAEEAKADETEQTSSEADIEVLGTASAEDPGESAFLKELLDKGLISQEAYEELVAHLAQE